MLRNLLIGVWEWDIIVMTQVSELVKDPILCDDNTDGNVTLMLTWYIDCGQ